MTEYGSIPSGPVKALASTRMRGDDAVTPAGNGAATTRRTAMARIHVTVTVEK
jgi:hypothetical protein